MASSSRSMEESTRGPSFSDLEMRLQSCQDASQSLKERIAVLKNNLKSYKRSVERYDYERRILDNGLMRCGKDKEAVAAKCTKLYEMMKWTMPHELSLKTEVRTSSEELKNCNKGKAIASAGIQTRKRASELSDIESMPSPKDWKKRKFFSITSFE